MRVKLLARDEVVHYQFLRALLCQRVEHVVKSAAALVRRSLSRIAAEIAYRLEVDTLDRRDMLFRKCDYLTKPVQVHARYHNGDEQHADAELLAVFDSFQLYIQHVPAAYRVVYLIIHAVEL